MENQPKPRLAIVGVGDYYRMISPGIEKVFETVLRVDKTDYEPMPGALKNLVQSHHPDAVMILTPNRFHAEHLEEIAPIGTPIFIEKPLVTTLEDLKRVENVLKVNPAIYCSDFYTDIWDAPLMKWLGMPIPKCLDPYLEILAPEEEAWRQSIAQLGPIKAVEATLLEGVGPASSFKGREWLWDSRHGGVLWDMGYHELALWFHLIGEPLEVQSVQRKTVDSAPPNASETYGAVQMLSASGIPFTFKVGKYVETGDDRAFTIIGANGEVSMDFVDPGRLSLNKKPLAFLHGERLDHAAAVFREYVDSKPTKPFGYEVATRCVNLMLKIREQA